ncbi:MAG: hypothetical protein LBN25_04590, partial [Christensenellaceae bacterium]|nr:hypothetical protein [Christensenellaceae bacterium]
MERLKSFFKYFTGAKVIGFAAIVAAVLAIGIALAVILPNSDIVPPVPDKDGVATITSLVPKNGGRIGIGADYSTVEVEIMYSDGTSEVKSLSELSVTGLDNSDEAVLGNVILSFGGFSQPVTYNVVPADWTITYISGEGGLISGETRQEVVSGNRGRSVEAVASAGYVFDSWSDGRKQTTRTESAVSRDMVITARFKKSEYHVIYFFDDGTTEPEKIVQNGSPVPSGPAASMSAMQKYGYVFQGWLINGTTYPPEYWTTPEALNAQGTPYRELVPKVTSDLEIFPVYEKYAADLTLDVTKTETGMPLGTVIDPHDIYPRGKDAIITVVPMPQYLFVRWEVLSSSGDWIRLSPKGAETNISINSGNNAVTFRTSTTGTMDNNYVLTASVTAITDSLQIRAIIAEERAVVRFESGGALIGQPIALDYGQSFIDYIEKNGVSNAGSITAGDTMYGYFQDNALVTPTMPGHTLRGWFIRGSAPNASGQREIVKYGDTVALSTTLVADWVPGQYSARFYLTEAEALSAPLEYTEENAYFGVESVNYKETLAGRYPENPPEYNVAPNYIYDPFMKFEGWKVASKIVEIGGDLSAQPYYYTGFVGKNYEIDENLTLYPVFTPKTATVSFSITGIATAAIDGTLITGIDETVTRTESHTVFITVPESSRGTGGSGYFLKAVTYQVGSKVGNTVVYDEPETVSIDAGYNAMLTFAERGAYEYIKITVYSSLDSNDVTVKLPGDVGVSADGVPVWNAAIAEEEGKNFSAEYDLTIPFKYGASRVLTFVSLNKTIQSVVVDSTGEYNLPVDFEQATVPSGATYFSFVTPQITADGAEIEVTATGITYNVLPTQFNNTMGGVSVPTGTTRAYGANSLFEIEAIRGYYIKTVTINGVNIDLYNFLSAVQAAGGLEDGGYYTSNVRVNYSLSAVNESIVIEGSNGSEVDLSGEKQRDSRVTRLALTVDGNRRTDITVSVTFERMYYNIVATVSGSGTVTPQRLTAYYGESPVLIATTQEGNFVRVFSINGIDRPTFEDESTTQSLEIGSLALSNAGDKAVSVYFARRSYTITVEQLGGGDDFSYSVGGGVPYRGGTSVSVRTGDNAAINIAADAGYYINQIAVYDPKDTANYLYFETIGFNVTSHTMTLENISEEY